MTGGSAPRRFPRGEDYDAIMQVVEWVQTSPEALRLDGSATVSVRGRLVQILGSSERIHDEGLWIQVMDLALGVWSKGYAEHRRQRLADVGL